MRFDQMSPARYRTIEGLTSSSEVLEYPEFCATAAADDEVFAGFRSKQAYQTILEHFDADAGRTYLEKILTQSPDCFHRFERFRNNDRLGGATRYDYGKFGLFSPSTLRYASLLLDIESLFGNLAGKKVVEIGGGYGGLARLICSEHDVRDYTLFDLPQVLGLARKYLAGFGDDLLDKFRFETLDRYSDTQQFDLLISTCALTECLPTVQEEYLTRVVQNSKAGFVLYNVKAEAYHPAVLLEKIRSMRFEHLGSLPEVPRTSPRNFLLIWSTDIPNVALKPLPYGLSRGVYRHAPFLLAMHLAAIRQIKGLKDALTS